MNLKKLFESDLDLPQSFSIPINHLKLDSRKLEAGDLFFAVKGTVVDGTQFIHEAIHKRVAAVIQEGNPSYYSHEKVPIISIPALKSKISHIAAKFYNYPSERFSLIGVTGTNGKTSCTHYLAQILESIGHRTGVIGTLGSGYLPQLQLFDIGLTTPDAITLQEIFSHFVDSSADYVAMEVSSHSIDQHRVNFADFDIGVFTNLSQDHLDYHGTMENYAKVKESFIASPEIDKVVINADDEYGKIFIRQLKDQKTVWPFSLLGAFNDRTTYANHIETSLQGISALVMSPWGEGEIHLPLVGQFNLSNALALIATLCALGIKFDLVTNALSQLVAVKGRMQKIGGEHSPLIIVDYSHSPDSLKNALLAIRAHLKGRICCVFGCGGERDQGKRPIMASIAESLADFVIVTNDNPRHESPKEIAKQIFQGFKFPKNVHLELDRSKAIEKSIQWASNKDCILIAGKGAENYQLIDDQKIPFDDALVVKKYLNRIHSEEN